MSLLLSPLTDEEVQSLTPHERAVMKLIQTLSGSVRGYPDDDRKLFNVTKAWAEFISLEPYHVADPPALVPFLSREELDAQKAPYMWKEGVIPGEWLVNKMRKGCKFFPTSIEARLMYCRTGGFPPADGVEPVALDFVPAEE